MISRLDKNVKSKPNFWLKLGKIKASGPENLKNKRYFLKQYWGLVVFGSLALVVIISGSLSGYAITKIQQAENQERQNKIVNKIFMITDDDPSAGSPQAKVHIVEFADFQCPFSKKVKPIIDDIIKTYEDKIHFIYRNYPIESHIYGQKAAEASECAAEQGKFWELYDSMFANQKDLKVEDIKKQALEISMPDMVKFNKCLDSGQYEQEVKDDYSVAEKAGAIGTPTFFINGEIIHGAVSKDELMGVINRYLK